MCRLLGALQIYTTAGGHQHRPGAIRGQAGPCGLCRLRARLLGHAGQGAALLPS